MVAEPAVPIASPATAPRLELHGLSVRRGGRSVLEGLDLSVRRGEIFGLLGPNGAGKTTVFRILCGLLAPREGGLRVDGEPMAFGARRLRERMGVVFQDPALDRRLTARQNVRLAAALYGVPRAEARRRVAGLLERAGLAERADEPVDRLSGGMRRRVELARALVHEPPILLLDEPTVGLDEAAYRQFWSDLLALRAARGLTLVVTTHRADEAERCDRLAFLHEGRIVACDSPEALRARLRGDFLLLDAADPAALCETVATRFGLEPRLVEGRVVVRGERIHELVPRLVESLPAGLLRSVEVRRAGLGEVFLELTGHTLDRERPA